MGCKFSSSRTSSTLSTIRVVHLNGYVEDFDYPLTAAEVTGKPTKHFVCTPAQLASGGPKPLKSGTQLEPGSIYFLLPYSTIQSDVSPLDLATIARRLAKIAKTSQAQLAKSPSRNSTPGSSPMWCSPASSPNWFSAQPIRVEPQCSVLVANGSQRSFKARPWKPILDPISEKSFNWRSESDLQEKQSEASK